MCDARYAKRRKAGCRSALAKVNATGTAGYRCRLPAVPRLGVVCDTISTPRESCRSRCSTQAAQCRTDVSAACSSFASLFLQINQRSLLGRCAAPQHPFCLLLTPAVGNRDQGYCGFGGEPGCVLLPSDVAHAGLGPLG